MNLTKDFELKEFSSNKHNKSGFEVEPVPLSLIDNVRELAKNLQVIRHKIGKPIIINSGYRTEEYNRSVGGKKNSYHLKAMAADLSVEGMKPTELHSIILDLIENKYISEGGVGIYDTFVHYDIRGTKARWDERKR